MTELAFFHTQSQKDAFNELDCEEYEISAVLDSKTSYICQEFDGKVFKVKDMQSGLNAPPLHPHCRSIVIPYYDDYGKGTRIAGDGKDKYHIPSNMKYNDWKKEFVVSDDKHEIKDKENEDNTWRGLNYSNPYDKQSAIIRLKDKYGIEFKDSKKYPIDGELLSDCVAWLDSFNSNYPDFLELSPCKIPVIGNMPPSKMKNSVGLYSYYPNIPKVEGLYLNAKLHSDINGFQEYVKKCIESKWYPQNATIHKTFVHEFGHHVSNSMSWITDDYYWEHKFIKECIEEFKIVEPEYKYDTYRYLDKYVSNYAASSESELFAEAFAEYFGGEYPRKFAKIFGTKLELVLKNLKK